MEITAKKIEPEFQPVEITIRLTTPQEVADIRARAAKRARFTYAHIPKNVQTFYQQLQAALELTDLF